MGTLLSSTDEAGVTTTIETDALGLDKSIDVGNGQLKMTMRFDGAGRLRERHEIDASGDAQWLYTYPGDGWVVEKAPAPSSAAAREHRKRLNGRGQVVSTHDDSGSSTGRESTFEYDGQGISKAVTIDGPNWTRTITRAWDGQGRPTAETDGWQGVGPDSSALSYAYDAGIVWTGRHAVTTREWKTNGAPATAPTESADYDGEGHLEQRTIGVVTDTWIYDALGRLKTSKSSDELPHAYLYNSDGRLKSETYGTEVTLYGYTLRGDVAEVETPDGRLATTDYEYQVDPTKRRALPVRQTLAGLAPGTESTTRAIEYDDFGRQSATTEGFGTADAKQTFFRYGGRGELLSVTQATGAVWSYGYDALLRLTSVTPPAGSAQKSQAWSYEDGLGRTTQYTLGTGTPWTTVYTGPSGATTTPLNEVITSVTDGRGRVAAINYGASGSTAPGIAGKRFSYDGLDTLVGLTDIYAGLTGQGTQRSTWAYDGSHRLTSVTRALAGTTTSTIGYTYEPNSRRRSTRTTDGANTIGWSYDALKRLTTVTGPWSLNGTVVTWEPGGQRLKTLGDESFEYDGRGWLKTVTDATGIRGYPEYDGRGNRLKETKGGLTRQFKYDDADRLILSREWDGHIEGWKLHADGAKDEAKEWPAVTPWPSAATDPFAMAGATKHTNYSYGATLGALEAIKDAATNADILRYGVDANGQVTSRTAQGRALSYGWDADGRLVTSTEVAGGMKTETQTSYDGLGLRREEKLTTSALPPLTGSTSSTQKWLWAGENGEEEVAEGTKQTAHVAGFRLGDGATRFSHDGLGSIVSQTDGFTSSTINFSAWGLHSATGTPQSNAGFTGYRNDSILGLNYAQQRWYDPAASQFVSRDSLGAESFLENPNEIGVFSYVGENPLRFVDRDGRELGRAIDEDLYAKVGKVHRMDVEVLDDDQLRGLLLLDSDWHSYDFVIRPGEAQRRIQMFANPKLSELSRVELVENVCGMLKCKNDLGTRLFRRATASNVVQKISGSIDRYQSAWDSIRTSAQDVVGGATYNLLDSPRSGALGNRFNRGLSNATAVPVGMGIDLARTEIEGSVLAGGFRAAEATFRNSSKLLKPISTASSVFDGIEGGRRGGKLYSATKLNQLKKYLDKKGVDLVVGDALMGPNKAGGFLVPHDVSRPQLLLRDNPTQYEVWHELLHFIQWKQIGSERYLKLPRNPTVFNAPEQFVYDRLRGQRRWSLLNEQQQEHATDYIRRVGGFFE